MVVGDGKYDNGGGDEMTVRHCGDDDEVTVMR